MMSNNEIIKAFENLVKNKSINLNLSIAVQMLLVDTLVVLNRQKAENAALSFQLAEAKLTSDIVKQIDKEPFVEVYKSLINEQKAEIERLKNSFDAQASLIEEKSLAYDRICVKHRNEINTAKSEAIKEFEKLVTRRLNCNTPRGAHLLNIINEVKKEMVGDDNA